MPKHSRRFNEIKTRVDSTEVHEPAEAIRLVKDAATAKFDGAVEVHLRTGVDRATPSSKCAASSPCPRARARSPHLVFAGPDGRASPQRRREDYVGGEDLAERIPGQLAGFRCCAGDA